MSRHSRETGKRVGLPQASSIVTVCAGAWAESGAVCVEAQAAKTLANNRTVSFDRARVIYLNAPPFIRIKACEKPDANFGPWNSRKST